MKKILIGLVLAAGCILLSSQTAFAHVLITDETNTKGVILHIIPDDDPIAGEESTLYFDTQEQLASQGNSVKLTVKSVSGEEQTIEMKIDGSLATTKYTFPAQGVYNLVFTVTIHENTYIFNQSQRVSRGVATSVLNKPTYAWAEVLVITSGIGFAVLLIVAINRRKDIAKHSSF